MKKLLKGMESMIVVRRGRRTRHERQKLPCDEYRATPRALLKPAATNMIDAPVSFLAWSHHP
jgi:hypothetical protein